MSLLFSILIFIFVLCVLVIVHELGHFVAAKLFGIRVDEFAVGFRPGRIFSYRYGETEYSFNALLVGGFVRIFGEQSEDADEKDPHNFAHRSRWIQATVVIAGIVMNLLFAWILFSTIYMIGIPTEVTLENKSSLRHIELTIIDVLPQSSADRAGLRGGDVVESIQTGDTSMSSGANADEARAFIVDHADQSLVIKVLRSGTEQIFVARPSSGVLQNDPNRKVLGVEFDDIGVLALNPLQAATQGASLTWRATAATVGGLSGFFLQLIEGRASFSDVAGPIGITAMGSSAVREGIVALLSFAAVISLNLGVINVLPIPGLDGGRLLFIVIEGIRGKAISERLASRLTFVSFALLILLVVLVSYHDLYRLPQLLHY